MITINNEIALSLVEAGIGKRFHHMTLEGLPVLGPGAKEWLVKHGPGIRSGVTSAVFEGVGLSDVITLLARGLHLHGVGCKIVPLVRMRKMIVDPEFREAVTEIDCLILMNAQDRHRGNPLHDAVAAEVEYVLRQRYDSGRSTFLQVAFTPRDKGEDRSYWSDEFWSLAERFERVTMQGLIDLGKAAAK
jgi:hypothetical protein